jgi:hypothetical protein
MKKPTEKPWAAVFKNNLELHVVRLACALEIANEHAPKASNRIKFFFINITTSK